MKQISIFFLSIFLISTSGKSQVINWQAAIGGANQSWPTDLTLTPDSGFALAIRLNGHPGFEVTDSSFGGMEDYWVVKYNSQKKIQWQKRLGGNLSDYVRSIKVARDGGLLIGGSSNSGISTTKNEISVLEDPWILKLDTAGNVVWQNTIRANAEDFMWCMDTTIDNGVIMAITTNSTIGLEKTVPLLGQKDSWLVKLDSSGAIQWQNVVNLPGASEVYLVDIIQLDDGGYAGLALREAGSFYTAFIRFDSLGNVIWLQNIASSATDDYPLAIISTADKGFLLAYSSYGDISPWKSENAIGFNDVWLIKTDSLGAYVWDNTIGGTGADFPFSMCLNATGEIFISGASTSTKVFDKSDVCRGSFDVWILKLSANGVKLWDKTVGSDRDDRGVGIDILPSGDLIVAATSYSDKGYDRANFRRSFSDTWLFTLSEKYNEITGNAFTDVNLNAVKDSGDFIPQNLKIQTNDSNLFSFISYDGSYKLQVEDNNYSIFPAPNPYYGFTPASNAASFTGFNQTDSLNDFILQPQLFVQDLKVSLAPPALLRPGFDASYMISCYNKGTVPVPSQVYFKLFPHTTYVSSPLAPVLQTSDSVLWDIGVVNPGQNKTIQVTIKLDTIIQVGDILNSYTQALPIATDFAPSDNNATWESIVRGSLDPNDILVDKHTIEYSTLPSSPTLRYTIRFQNTGNAPASIVSIVNNLPIKLIDSTFELEASSHPVNVEYTKNSRMLKFDFPGILLPDSGANLEQSMGFVQYSIRPLTNMVPGDSIRNKALIYFDYNPPVVTNYAITEIVQTTAVGEMTAIPTLRVYPNPAAERLNISLPENFQQGIIMVYDLQGRLILQEKVTNTNVIYPLNLHDVDPGMYSIYLLSGNNRYSSRFIRQ